MQINNIPCTVLGKIKVRFGVKEVLLGNKLRYAVIVANESIIVLDLVFQDTSATIRRLAYPKSARLSKCQRLIVAHFTDNFVGIYQTQTGQLITNILGVPRSTYNFIFSGDSKKLIYANNTTLCLWNIPKGELQISSNQWRNINCYAINQNGKQIAIGTYGGSILVLTLISAQKVTQIELKRHKSCVMLITYERQKIISLSYDKVLLKTTISSLSNGQKGISYEQFIFPTIPRSLKEAGGLIFFSENDGTIGWLTKELKLVQYSDGLYAVTQHNNNIIFMRYKQGLIQWFQK